MKLLSLKTRLVYSLNITWKKGEIKFFVRETATDSFFTARYYMKNKRARDTSLVIKDPNAIAITLRDVSQLQNWLSNEEILLVRTYPKNR